MCRSTFRPNGCWPRRRAGSATIRSSSVLPIAADFTQAFRSAGVAALARASASSLARPSAISSRIRRCAFLRHAGRMLGRGAFLIVGVDLVKDGRILNAAYDDGSGRDREVQSQHADTRINSLENSAAISIASAISARARSRNGAVTDRDAPLPAASARRTRVGQHLRISRRRDHSHREQLQVTVESSGALARLRLEHPRGPGSNAQKRTPGAALRAIK